MSKIGIDNINDAISMRHALSELGYLIGEYKTLFDDEVRISGDLYLELMEFTRTQLQSIKDTMAIFKSPDDC